MRLLLGTVVAGVLGAALGFAAQWPISLAYMRLTGAGYTGVEPRWDTAFATFDAWNAVLPGSVLAMAAYPLFFSRFPSRQVARSVPTLFVFVVLGAIPGLWIGPLAIITVTLAFLAGCIFVARRLSQQTGIVSHPLS